MTPVEIPYFVPWDVYEIVTKADADEMIAKVAQTKRCAVDTETTGLKAFLGDKAFMATFSPDRDSAYACRNLLIVGYIMEAIQQHKLIFHNFKFDALMLYMAGAWQPVGYMDLDIEDTMLAFRVFHSKDRNAKLKVASAQYCEPGIDVDGPEKAVMAWFVQDLMNRRSERRRVNGKYVVDKDKHYDRVPWDIMFPYATQDTAITIRSLDGMDSSFLSSSEPRAMRLKALYHEDVLLCKLLVEAELHGWNVDREAIQSKINLAYDKLNDYLNEFDDIAPGVDVFSSKQLSKYVYETLGEPITHLTKTGLPSTDESALSDLVENPEIGKLLVSIRQWKKLKDKCEEIKTYTYKDNHVHSDLKQGGARTSRMSSGSPALQNIANWKEDQPWTWIRDAFVPEEDYEWLLADYSQIEMRVLAHYSRDENMVKAFMTGLDLHKITAQNMFGTEDVNKQQRSFGKVMNFTISYGGGKRRICDSLRFGSAQCDPVPITDARRALVTLVSYVTDEQLVDPYPALAAELYNLYRKNFPAVLSLKSDVELTARSRGYIVNAYGREIPVPREETHKGLNYLIQSSAADLMKQAMNRTWTVCLTYARDNDLVPWKDIALFMSIHDELIWKIPIGHSVALANAIRPTLEEWPRFRVPIAVDFAQVAQGDSWATKKGLKL